MWIVSSSIFGYFNSGGDCCSLYVIVFVVKYEITCVSGKDLICGEKFYTS